jgi:uncharacterized protein YceK
MKKTLFLLICAAVLSGCASQQVCADAAKSVAHANSMAEIAKWNAIQEIAKTGDVTAKVAALQVIQSHKTVETQVICKNF